MDSGRGNKMNKQLFSDLYLDWVRQSKVIGLTNTQYRFAEWLLEEDNAKQISQIGDLSCVFESVKWYLKQKTK